MSRGRIWGTRNAGRNLSLEFDSGHVRNMLKKLAYDATIRRALPLRRVAPVLTLQKFTVDCA